MQKELKMIKTQGNILLSEALGSGEGETLQTTEVIISASL